MATKKKTPAKARAKAAKRTTAEHFEVGATFKGALTPEHVKALRAEIKKMMPDLVDRVRHTHSLPLGNFNCFDRKCGD